MAKATYLSRIPSGTDISVAHVGAEAMSTESQPITLLPQGEQVAGVLEAKDRHGFPLYPTVAILLPRRSTKTTSIWAVLLGRCASIPGYKVVTTAQDGNRARKRFSEIAGILERNGFAGTIRWSNGDESITWPNGSRLWVVPPNAGAFRGEAADVLLFDEAGELSPDKSEELLSGALPLLDTRPYGQAIIAGTPSLTRAGLLWDTLQKGRTRTKGYGIVDYSIKDEESSIVFNEDGTTALNRKVLRRVHPGIGTLTTMAKMAERFESMQLPQFEREYLCRFPTSSATSAIDPVKWAAAEADEFMAEGRVGIAYDCAYDGTSASIAYAWRDEVGIAYVEVVRHDRGTSWVAAAAHKASQRRNKVAVAYDDIGANRDPYAAIQRMKPLVKMHKMEMKDTLATAQRITSELAEGRLRHFGQSDLDAAVENTTWRTVGKSGRAFGQKDSSGAAINPLVAASLALWSYDQGKDRALALPFAG